MSRDPLDEAPDVVRLRVRVAELEATLARVPAATEAALRALADDLATKMAPVAEEVAVKAGMAVHAEWTRQVAAVVAALTWLGDVIATSSRDWAKAEDLALVYGVVLGWHDRDDPEDVAEGDGALREIAALFPAGSKRIEWMQTHRAAIRALVAARAEP